jgi:NAD(P)H-dependent FMN reductase
MALKILGVSGSLRDGAYTLRLVNLAIEAAKTCGAEVELLDLREHPMPLYEAHEDYDSNEIVNRVIRIVDSADGFIVGSPEYHGCMSGATKNFFDFLYSEISGKLFGLISATGGSQGNGCFDNMRAAVQYCHGWSLPYNVSASGRDFDAEGNLTNTKVLDRLRRMGRDVTTYAPLLRQQFLNDLKQKSPNQPGFAQWMA